MAAREFLALNEGTPQVLAPQSGDTYVANSAVAFNIGTITANTPILDLSATWNNGAVAFQGLKLNVTNTASLAGSKFIELQANGTTKFAITRGSQSSGFATVSDALGSIEINNVFGVQLIWNAGNKIVVDGIGLGISTIGAAYLATDANNILAQRNGTAAQRQRVYNTFIDSSNGEWFDIDWATTANVCTIGPRANGTGVVRAVTAVGVWTFSSTIAPAGLVAMSPSQQILWQTQGDTGFVGDGVFRFRNNAGSGFDRLQLGGTTNSFGAIGRDGAGISFVGAAGGSTAWTKVPGVAVASLPAAATAGTGARSFVTDALSPVFGSPVTGGGAVRVPVYVDGTPQWCVG